MMKDFQCSNVVWTSKLLLNTTHIELEAKFDNLVC